jgi:hypothetical protein
MGGVEMQPNVWPVPLSVSALLLCATCVLGGPNSDAVVTLDRNARTDELEQTCADNGTGSDVHVSIMVDSAVGLTGFFVRLSFDSSALSFTRAVLTAPGSDATPLLQTNGGEAGPMLVKLISPSELDIATAVKSAEGVGVDGGGLLAYVVFSRVGAGDCAVRLVKAQLSDANHAIDTVAVE